MHYFLCLRIRRFYLPDQEKETPTLVTREKRVLDANESARVRGVVPGMPISEARAILAQCELIPWKPEDYEERQRSYLDACLPFTETLEPTEQHEVFADLSAHPDPRDIADQLIQTLNRHAGKEIQAGAGPSKWIARLAADWSELDLAIDDPEWFLEPLPVESLLPVEPEHRNRLRLLGHRTFGQVAQVPLRTLVEQFGEAGARIHRVARGEWFEPVRALYPEAAFREQLRFEGPVEDKHALESGFRELAGRLGRKLEGEEKQSAHLWVHLEEEDRPPRLLKRETQKPMRTAGGVLAALRQALRGELRRPVLAIGITLPRLEPARHIQRDLTQRAPKGDTAETLRGLQAIFGEEAVKLGSQITPPRRDRVLREWKHATGWR